MKKQVLSFDTLSKEMELIGKIDNQSILGGSRDGEANAETLSDPYQIDNSGFRPGGGGGSVFWQGSGDCVFQSVAFVTGRNTMDIQREFVDFYNNTVVRARGLSDLWLIDPDMAGEMGVPANNINSFLKQYGLGSGGEFSNTGFSAMNGAGIILIPGHAYNITGMASPFEYYTYDAQQGTTGRISINDSRIMGIYTRQEYATHLPN